MTRIVRLAKASSFRAVKTSVVCPKIAGSAEKRFLFTGSWASWARGSTRICQRIAWSRGWRFPNDALVRRGQGGRQPFAGGGLGDGAAMPDLLVSALRLR